MSYDTSCYELAKSFIDDVGPSASDPENSMYHELAQRIQDTIEDFLDEKGLTP